MFSVGHYITYVLSLCATWLRHAWLRAGRTLSVLVNNPDSVTLYPYAQQKRPCPAHVKSNMLTLSKFALAACCCILLSRFMTTADGTLYTCTKVLIHYRFGR